MAFKCERYFSTTAQNSATTPITLQTMDISNYDLLSFTFCNNNSSGNAIKTITLSFSNDLGNNSQASGTGPNFLSANTSNIPYPGSMAGTSIAYTTAINNAFHYAQVQIVVTSCWNAQDFKVVVCGHERFGK